MCKVIIVSNPTAVEVVLSCIEVVVGVLTIFLGTRFVSSTTISISAEIYGYISVSKLTLKKLMALAFSYIKSGRKIKYIAFSCSGTEITALFSFSVDHVNKMFWK